jgi:hypothetical protein
VETMSRHLESERNRLRTALGDILRWVDQNVQPNGTQDDIRREPAPQMPPAPPVDATPTASPPAPAPAPAAPSPTPAPAAVIQGGNRPAGGPPAGSPSPKGSGTGPTGEVTQMRPVGPTGTTTHPANTDASLPL